MAFMQNDASLPLFVPGIPRQRAHFRERLETFKSSTAWMDVFNATGVKRAMSIDQMPLDDYLNLLVTQGYLNYPEKDLFEIGASGKSLAATFSDPGMCTLTLTLQTWEDGGRYLRGLPAQ